MLARAYSAVWMLVGIVTISILTAEISSTLTTIELQGEQIRKVSCTGILRNTMLSSLPLVSVRLITEVGQTGDEQVSPFYDTDDDDHHHHYYESPQLTQRSHPQIPIIFLLLGIVIIISNSMINMMMKMIIIISSSSSPPPPPPSSSSSVL